MQIRVVNLSLGVQDEGGYRNDILAWAVEQLWREGITSSPPPATTASSATGSTSRPQIRS